MKIFCLLDGQYTNTPCHLPCFRRPRERQLSPSEQIKLLTSIGLHIECFKSIEVRSVVAAWDNDVEGIAACYGAMLLLLSCTGPESRAATERVTVSRSRMQSFTPGASGTSAGINCSYNFSGHEIFTGGMADGCEEAFHVRFGDALEEETAEAEGSTTDSADSRNVCEMKRAVRLAGAAALSLAFGSHIEHLETWLSLEEIHATCEVPLPFARLVALAAIAAVLHGFGDPPRTRGRVMDVGVCAFGMKLLAHVDLTAEQIATLFGTAPASTKADVASQIAGELCRKLGHGKTPSLILAFGAMLSHVCSARVLLGIGSTYSCCRADGAPENPRVLAWPVFNPERSAFGMQELHFGGVTDTEAPPPSITSVPELPRCTGVVTGCPIFATYPGIPDFSSLQSGEPLGQEGLAVDGGTGRGLPKHAVPGAVDLADGPATRWPTRCDAIEFQYLGSANDTAGSLASFDVPACGTTGASCIAGIERYLPDLRRHARAVEPTLRAFDLKARLCRVVRNEFALELGTLRAAIARIPEQLDSVMQGVFEPGIGFRQRAEWRFHQDIPADEEFPESITKLDLVRYILTSIEGFRIWHVAYPVRELRDNARLVVAALVLAVVTTLDVLHCAQLNDPVEQTSIIRFFARACGYLSHVCDGATGWSQKRLTSSARRYVLGALPARVAVALGYEFTDAPLPADAAAAQHRSGTAHTTGRESAPPSLSDFLSTRVRQARVG